MSLKTLTIVKEEFERIRGDAEAMGRQPDYLDLPRLESAIKKRTRKELNDGT